MSIIKIFKILSYRAHKICSTDIFSSEINKIKLLLNKNGYPQELVKKTIKLHMKILDKRNM